MFLVLLIVLCCIELHCNLLISRRCFSHSCLIDRLPQIQTTTDFIIEKTIFPQIQDIITEYSLSRFSANFSAIRE